MSASRTSSPRALQTREHRKPAQPERDRQDADVQADQRERAEVLRRQARRLDARPRISCSNGVPVDVRILTSALRRRPTDTARAASSCPGASSVEPAIARERPVRVVHDHLRDRDRIGAVVQHRQADAVAGERRARDRQALDRRHARRAAAARPAASRTIAAISSGEQQHSGMQRAHSHDRRRSRCHGAPPRPRTCPSSPAPRTRSGARGT